MDSSQDAIQAMKKDDLVNRCGMLKIPTSRKQRMGETRSSIQLPLRRLQPEV